MANFKFSLLIEYTLVLGLVTSAAFAFFAWREPACGVLLTYSAVRIVLYGSGH